jgi:hypothetical protein
MTACASAMAVEQDELTITIVVDNAAAALSSAVRGFPSFLRSRTS